MQACRDRLKISPGMLQQAGHAGLLLRRFLQVAVKAEGEKHPAARSELYSAARTAAANACALYRVAFSRWLDSVPKATSERLDVQGRLIVGLGGDNVLETGITLHHTYGVPIIPGSALKGLAAHYCDQVWGLADPKFRKARGKKDEAIGTYHEVLFGATEDSGHITFHDAWIIPDTIRADGTSGLVLDVITPHHSDYYSEKTYESGAKKGDLIPPTDFDGPNPITFLSVAGAFHIAISCDVPGESGDCWAKLAFDLLKESLREWGVGGKTSSGYGRLGTINVSSDESSASSPRSAAPSASATAKRASGTPTKVTILESRPKGYKVEESGRQPGTLTLGPCPSPSPQLNEVVDVLVHVDDPKSPQYKWPDPNAKPPKPQQPKKGNRR